MWSRRFMTISLWRMKNIGWCGMESGGAISITMAMRKAMFENAGAFVGGYALVVEDGGAWLIDEEFQKLKNLCPADSVSTMGELYSVRLGDDMRLYQLQ